MERGGDREMERVVRRRQRMMSCPAVGREGVLLAGVATRHSRGAAFLDDWRGAHDRRVLSTSASDPCQVRPARPGEVGVRPSGEWRPRYAGRKFSEHVVDQGDSIAIRARFSLNEDRDLAEISVDARLSLAQSPQDSWMRSPWRSESPFTSELFVRVLYMIGSGADQTHTEQLLTEEQMRENQLKEQQVGVERLRQELASGDSSQSKGGTVTPGELIYQSIPNIIKRHSFNNLPTHRLNSEDKKDSSKQSTESLVDCHIESSSHPLKNKIGHRLTGREKSMLAPLTF